MINQPWEGKKREKMAIFFFFSLWTWDEEKKNLRNSNCFFQPLINVSRILWIKIPSQEKNWKIQYFFFGKPKLGRKGLSFKFSRNAGLSMECKYKVKVNLDRQIICASQIKHTIWSMYFSIMFRIWSFSFVYKIGVRSPVIVGRIVYLCVIVPCQDSLKCHPEVLGLPYAGPVVRLLKPGGFEVTVDIDVDHGRVLELGRASVSHYHTDLSTSHVSVTSNKACCLYMDVYILWQKL